MNLATNADSNSTEPEQSNRVIRLRGVDLHNLKGVDIDIPHGQYLTLCGVSGSGKTSLALNTLYAEGQRRYVESFSPYTRQFLEQLEKPSADSIEGVPPAIAIRAALNSANRRTTIGSATEINEYLRLLFSRLATAGCPKCGEKLEKDTPESAAAKLRHLPDGSRIQVAFGLSRQPEEGLRHWMSRYGFVRAIVEGKTVDVSSLAEEISITPETLVVVDRLTSKTAINRVRDSLETAFDFGERQCVALTNAEGVNGGSLVVDDQEWKLISFASKLACSKCAIELPSPEPNLFNFNSELGACASCLGAGFHSKLDPAHVVPNPRLTLEEGAISIWNLPKRKSEFQTLLDFCDAAGIPKNIAYDELSEEFCKQIWEGEQDFCGVRSFFQEQFDKKSSNQRREFEQKWFSPYECEACNGTRLNESALAFKLAESSIADLGRMEIGAVHEFLGALDLMPWQQEIAKRLLGQITRRLEYLLQVGVGYLSLERAIRSLSSGEAQRVMLTTSLGSTLVNMLYVLDEPASGLHADDVERLIGSIQKLHQRGNTIVCVDHNEAIIESAERILEIGPGAGEEGGQVVFDGDCESLLGNESSLTGKYLAGYEGLGLPEERRSGRGKMKLTGATGNNLKNLDVVFPLGCLCVVSGVSGSGKSSLVQQTLFPALAQKREKSSIRALPYREILGDNQISEVVMIDQLPIGRSPRSNPVTYVKAFDDIRKLFAEQLTATAKGFTAGHFSFNVAKGRCPKCEGDGHLAIDMQFLTDVYVKCESCRGTRFRSEILEVKHRGKNIAQVLDMPIGKAFSFFRGQPKVQAKLKTLMDVGLGYLPLGQPATTLSTGEAQRLKLALYLNAKNAKRCLFIMDEPTAGLHMADIDNLIETFEALIAVGHSLIVVEHNLQLMLQADWIIDLGPAAGKKGGMLVASGTPESLAAQHEKSRTGFHLKQIISNYE